MKSHEILPNLIKHIGISLWYQGGRRARVETTSPWHVSPTRADVSPSDLCAVLSGRENVGKVSLQGPGPD